MQDTSPELRRLARERFAQMTPMARVLVEASLPEGLDPMERRFRICERFYGERALRTYPRRVA